MFNVALTRIMDLSIYKSTQKVQKSFNIREWPKRFCHPIWPLCIGTYRVNVMNQKYFIALRLLDFRRPTLIIPTCRNRLLKYKSIEYIIALRVPITLPLAHLEQKSIQYLLNNQCLTIVNLVNFEAKWMKNIFLKEL